MQPAPKSLILDLLSTLGRSAAPVRALISAAAVFGIAENSLRVALARLLRSRGVERDERGLYRLGAEARAVSAEVRAWRRIDEIPRRWSGDWLGVLTAGPAPRGRRIRERRARALRFLGFRVFHPNLQLRPDNWVGGVEDVRQRLSALGLEPEASVFRISGLDESEHRRALQLWDSEDLESGYRETCDRLSASAHRLPGLERSAAMRESFLLGGQAIRQLVLDPLLPEPIVAAAPRRALVTGVGDYDRLGREVWAGWLGAGQAAPESLPADVRGLEAASHVWRAAS